MRRILTTFIMLALLCGVTLTGTGCDSSWAKKVAYELVISYIGDTVISAIQGILGDKEKVVEFVVAKLDKAASKSDKMAWALQFFDEEAIVAAIYDIILNSDLYKKLRNAGYDTDGDCNEPYVNYIDSYDFPELYTEIPRKFG